MLHKLVNFHYQIVFTSQVIQWNVFLVSCLGIWWRHDIWISEKSTFDYLKNEKSFRSEIKSISRSNLKSTCDLQSQIVHMKIHHCVKSVRIRSYSDPYFPSFGLNTERYSVYLSPNAEKYGLE